MDDEDFEFDAVESNPIPGWKLRWIDVAALGVGFLHDIAAVVEETLDGAQALLCSHANYMFNRDQFHQEAAVELETILEEGE